MRFAVVSFRWFLLLFFMTFEAPAFTPTVSTSTGSTGGDYLISPSFFYLSGLRTRSSREETAYFSSDIRLGYQFYPQLYLGLNYQMDQKNVESMGFTVESFNNTSKMKRNSYGVFATYFFESVHLGFTYFIESKLSLENKSGIGVSRYDYVGTGLQLDIGYRFSVWGISLGPQLSYKSYSYSKLNIDGDGLNQITPKLEESNFEPSIVAFFYF